MNIKALNPGQLYVGTLAGLSFVSTGFLAAGVLRNDNFADWYLLWNLFLAWLPLLFAYILVRLIRRSSWSSWPAISMTLAWLVFLPNSFYMVSDLIHLQDMPRTYILFDSLMFSLFVITGLLLGYSSLYMVQAQLRRRLSMLQTAAVVSLLLLLCSFAIYLGRELRWNSWDVLVNPAGILFDVSERFIDPLGHSSAFTVTAMFFVFLSSLYWALFAMLYTLRGGSDKPASAVRGSQPIGRTWLRTWRRVRSGLRP